MKVFLPLLALLILIPSSHSQYCKRALLNSYALEGEVVFTEKPHPICATVKKNCCTADDTKQILSNYNNFLKPKLTDFSAKMDDAFRNLEDLHYLANSVTLRTDLSGPQQAFCSTVQDQFKAFPFQKLMDDMRVGFALSSRLFRELHGTFYCAMCDFDAHQSFSLDTRSVALDSSVCLNILASNRLFLSAQNINLIQYLQNLQNLLDCNQFTDLFNFPFLYGDRQALANNFKNCYRNFDPDSMSPDCAAVCQNLGTGTISSVFEGDFDFIAQAAGYFLNAMANMKKRQGKEAKFNPLKAVQKLNEQNEEVNFIQVPNKREARVGVSTVAANSTGNGTGNGTARTNTTTTTTSTTTRPRVRKLGSAFDGLESQGSLSVIWDKLAHPVRSLFGYKTDEEKLKEMRKEGLLRLKAPRKAKAAQSLKKASKMFGKQISVISRSQKDILKRLRKAFRSSSNSRILSDDGRLDAHLATLPKLKSVFTPRLLAEAPAGSTKDSKYYEKLYDSMVFYPDQNSTEMNQRRTDPFDIGKFQINAVFGAGLNLGHYLGAMNWDIPAESLAKILKGASNLDDPDISLGFLLAVFTEEFGKLVANDIAFDYSIKVDGGDLSPDDATVKSMKPALYEPWEQFDSDTLLKLQQMENDGLDFQDSQPVAVFHSTYSNDQSFKGSRRLKQAQPEAKAPKRNNWSRKWTPPAKRRLAKAPRFESKADERLHHQMRRAKGYGHGRKDRSGRGHLSRGRNLSARDLLDQVEGTPDIQPWLNV